MFGIRQTGFERFRIWLTAAPAAFRRGLFAAVSHAVELQRNAIEQDTPVRTGTLASSWQTKVSETIEGVQGMVYSTSRYAAFVDRGTRLHGRARRMAERGVKEAERPVEALFRTAVGRVIDAL